MLFVCSSPSLPSVLSVTHDMFQQVQALVCTAVLAAAVVVVAVVVAVEAVNSGDGVG